MTHNLSMRGEKIIEFDMDITSITDYGIAMDAILSKKEMIPPQGARFDVVFDGRTSGRLSGRVTGVDYILARADWRIDLDIRATVDIEGGHRIALSGDGVATLRTAELIADLIENLRLTTAAKDYAWLNTRQIWGVGIVNLAARKIRVEAFLQ
jgi:Protein of unknown function (DUF3237)